MRWTRGLRTLLLALTPLAALLATSGTDAAEPQKPGLNDLIVLDPAVDENGLPIAEVDTDGNVEIPPTIHVHPYYYSEDKEYQAQILQGGPTVVVANHPKSGRKMYIDVTLPPGAPVIAYNKHSITYVYPDQRVVIKFGGLLDDHAVVKNVHGRGVIRVARDAAKSIHKHSSEHHAKSRLSHEIREAAKTSWNVVKGSAATVATVGAGALERARGAVRVLPLVQPLESLGKQLEERGAVEEVRQAGLQQAEGATKFIPTVR